MFAMTKIDVTSGATVEVEATASESETLIGLLCKGDDFDGRAFRVEVMCDPNDNGKVFVVEVIGPEGNLFERHSIYQVYDADWEE